MRSLSPSSQRLLYQVLARRSPTLLESMEDISRPPRELVNKICELTTDELCATGLRDDDEPNETGLRLEALIDELRVE